MKLIDADEMAANESEAYMSAQVKIDSPIALGLNSCVHRKIQQLIADTPTIDPESLRPVGKWKWCGSDRWNDAYQCSGCGEMNMDDSDYCPNCGARMEE